MIDKKIIQHIASLACLRLSDKEAEEYSQQLSKALSFFDKISGVKTDNIPPLVTPVEIENFLRDDQILREFSTEEILENAPDKSGNLFKVPPVVG